MRLHFAMQLACLILLLSAYMRLIYIWYDLTDAPGNLLQITVVGIADPQLSVV